jgi:hypothetical protein
MRALLLAAAAAASVGGAACTPRSALYDWDGYDDALYLHYKQPQDREAWVAALKTAVLAAEQEGRRVPPGLYAEYGYALYEEGVYPQAIAYFQKEREQWPESRFFMQKMIRNAEIRAGQPAPGATKGPAGALEKTP